MNQSLRSLTPLFMSLAFLLPGCASESESAVDDNGEEATEQSEGELSRLYHFDVINPKAVWKPQGLFLTFTRRYADLTVGYSVRIDNARNVITVTMDSGTNSTAHSRRAVRPETIKLTPPGLRYDRQYAVVVNNHKGLKLTMDWIYTAVAP